MKRQQIHIEGGKIKKVNFNKVGRDINKGFDKVNKGFATAGNEIGKFTNKQLLPAVVSAGIPLASSALGVLGTEFGIPPEITSSLSENLMKNYIPKQYQSNNKYVNLFSDALNMGLSGDTDPNSMMQLSQNLSGTIGKDLGLDKQIKTPMPSKDAYNPDNPYQDLMLQMMMNYNPIDTKHVKTTSQPYNQQTPIEDTSNNDEFDAIYGDSELGVKADSMKITKSPYQQKEGNINALLGSGLKKRRGRPKKKVIEEIEIYTKKKPSYKKFSHAKNSSLEQLLEAKSDREEKEANKAMKEMVDKQSRLLTSLGYGFKKKNLKK